MLLRHGDLVTIRLESDDVYSGSFLSQDEDFVRIRRFDKSELFVPMNKVAYIEKPHQNRNSY